MVQETEQQLPHTIKRMVKDHLATACSELPILSEFKNLLPTFLLITLPKRLCSTSSDSQGVFVLHVTKTFFSNITRLSVVLLFIYIFLFAELVGEQVQRSLCILKRM